MISSRPAGIEALSFWWNGRTPSRRSVSDLVDERLAQPGNVGQFAAVDELAEVLGQVLEDAGASGVRADA
jgi:hypothetical protein